MPSEPKIVTAKTLLTCIVKLEGLPKLVCFVRACISVALFRVDGLVIVIYNLLSTFQCVLVKGTGWAEESSRTACYGVVDFIFGKLVLSTINIVHRMSDGSFRV